MRDGNYQIVLKQRYFTKYLAFIRAIIQNDQNKLYKNMLMCDIMNVNLMTVDS